MYSTHTLDAELSVVGALLRDPSVARDCASLRPEDFATPELRRIHQAIGALLAEGRAVDLITVDERLHAMLGPEQAGPLVDLMVRAIQHTPTAANVGHYAAMVADHAARRRLKGLAARLQEMAEDERHSVAEVTEGVRQELRGLNAGAASWTAAQEVALAAYRRLDRLMAGKERPLRTGLEPLDKALFAGFAPGELTLLGARPGVGKSAMAGSIALHLSLQGAKVCIVSLEMSPEQYGQRLLSHCAGVDGEAIRRAELKPEKLDALAQSMSCLSLLPLTFLFKCRTLEGLCAAVRQRMDEEGLDLLIIDYLQLLRLERPGVSDYERVSEISRRLKELAVTQSLPILALAQLSRAASGRLDKRPLLSDLRDSGALEQDADNVLFLHRPESADDRGVPPSDRERFARAVEAGMHYLYLSVEKQRQGRTGFGRLLFDPKTLTYRSL